MVGMALVLALLLTCAPFSAAEGDSSAITATVGAANDGILLPGHDLQLSVSIHNGRSEPIDTARIRVSLSSQTFDSRIELQQWLNGTLDDRGSPVGDGTDVRLPPAQSTQVEITIPAASIPFSTWASAHGTHALTVTVTSPGGVVTAARNVVDVTNGTPASRKTGVSVLVPLTVPETADGLLSADTLKDYTRPTGTLSRQLDAVAGRAATIGVDPRILASIRILGSSVPDSARAWLDRLHSLPNELFALPYADADISAQAQSGLSTLLTPSSFDYGINDSLFTSATSSSTPAPPPGGQGTERPTKESLLSFAWSPSLGSLAWPDDLTVRTADLDIYAANGMNRTLVSSDNLVLPAGVSTATRGTVRGHEIVVVDSTLSAGLNAAASAGSDSDWRSQMTAITAGLSHVQEENQTSDVVLAVSREAAVDGGRLAQTLDAIDRLPWTHGTSLNSALAAPATDDISVVDSPESRKRLDQVSELLALARRVESFSAVLSHPELLRGKRGSDSLALLALSWRRNDTGWSAALAANRELVQKDLSSVSIDASDNVLQVSRDSSVPVYVRNSLPWPVAVRIDAATSNAVLDIDEASIGSTRIDAGSQGRIAIPVKARVGNGETDLRLQLTALDGTPIGDETNIRTSVRADWESVGTLVLGIGLVLFFGFGILRNIRRRRHSGTVEDDDPNAVLTSQPSLDEKRTEQRG
ncbi:DUF6049 family protein [Rathayibacter toxicus]|uniref:2-oxoglutarate dehydrogenase n=1 Tax=Rathayibacter toxicus TaxID=145458 RepID=A0A2S5YA54_9MICO|nr:hypothetical protein C5D15_00800 [Rathayibacter toxicus]PPG48288.1 hypothetical protein C5D16_00815 [Rathayibacter toxicus]PPH59284.1 hypothetical protein C5D30_00770 [Rathayibacter toxicus]PPH61397.1 hypothetical protein C5C93_00780 [Rathayibacter toxicus]PPH74436.1 hypothetical protein C5D24_00805 [Rathayibacter toxicus]